MLTEWIEPAAAAPVADVAHDAQLLAQIDAACERACEAIAPAWPLDRAIAVNPHWKRIGRPLREVAARMAVLGGIRVLPPRDQLRAAWAAGRIGPGDLALALAQCDAQDLGVDACVRALGREAGVAALPLLIDVLDDDAKRHTRLSWRQAITHQVSQTCAAYFDQRQADWQPARKTGLYDFWRETLTHDHGIGVLMGLPQLHEGLGALPATREAAERWVLQRLGLPQDVWTDYLEAVLLTVNGWASWCAYLGWQAGLEGRRDAHLRELLAIRLAWGAILLECKGEGAARTSFDALRRAWQGAPQRLCEAQDALRIDEVWQLAFELGYQRELAQRLQHAPGDMPPAPKAQAVFCIDVRSEPLRRALEAEDPGVQTLGFAGFFGLPAAYTPLGTAARRPQLPGLLGPAVEVTDEIVAQDGQTAPADAALARQRRFDWAGRWGAATRWPGAAFSSVEAWGWGYLATLGTWVRPGTAARRRDDLQGLPARYRSLCRPALAGLDAGAKADIAARALRAMGLAQGLAPLVLLVGHGSQSANNAQAAALDCGACCGQTGEVNARVMARLLNEPAVRDALRAQGIDVRAATVFVAALHNTTTDEIEAFDLDLLPEARRAEWDALQATLRHASDRVRRERAPALGVDPRLPHDALLQTLRRRANDGAQTRPEWGLAGNAAFILAPRHRTRGVGLAGRSFLHDYDAAHDADGSLLEALMTAPMLVTHWINWQYHASTCDPERLGSGNKVLHNVVGGHVGVFEGNGGDLRIGLARQSLHDGERWRHEPLRLTVVIDAPQAAIERVIGKHAVVRELVDNGWLHLWRFDGAGLQQRRRGTWAPVALAAAR